MYTTASTSTRTMVLELKWCRDKPPLPACFWL
jgi:hypothetical protein